MLSRKRIPLLGEVMDALYTSLPILSIINFFSITASLYLSAKPYLDIYTPWLSLGLFFGIFSIGIIILMLLVYKFVIPSLWAFRGSQMSGQNEKLDKILEILKDKEK